MLNELEFKLIALKSFSARVIAWLLLDGKGERLNPQGTLLGLLSFSLSFLH